MENIAIVVAEFLLEDQDKIFVIVSTSRVLDYNTGQILVFLSPTSETFLSLGRRARDQ